MDHLATNDVEDLALVFTGAWRDSNLSPVFSRRTLFMRLFMVYEVQLRGCSEMGSFWCILLKLVQFTGCKIYWTWERQREYFYGNLLARLWRGKFSGGMFSTALTSFNRRYTTRQVAGAVLLLWAAGNLGAPFHSLPSAIFEAKATGADGLLQEGRNTLSQS